MTTRGENDNGIAKGGEVDGDDLITAIVKERSQLASERVSTAVGTSEYLSGCRAMTNKLEKQLTNPKDSPSATAACNETDSLPENDVDKALLSNLAVEGTPGAHAIAPSQELASTHNHQDDNSSDASSCSLESRSHHDDTHSSYEDVTIPKAGRVAEENLEEATPVDSVSTTKKQRQHGMHLTFLMSVLVLVVIGVAVFIAFRVQSRKPNSLLPTLAPSVMRYTTATAPPTPAPPGVLDHFVETLPDYTLQSLQDPFSPQTKAYQWLVSQSSLVSTFPKWRQTQLFALATFFFAFEGESWPSAISKSWLNIERGECNWFSTNFGTFDEEGFQEGVTIFMSTDPCNKEGVFIDLALGGLDLSQSRPKIPPEISLLSSLKYLHLLDSAISDNLEEFLPSQLYTMPSLLEVGLSGNQLTGTIPSRLGSLMAGKTETFLTLSSNRLEGTIPPQLATFDTIRLAHNHLTGTLPPQLFREGSIVNEIKLHGNNLSGTIATELGRLTLLVELMLGSNQFSGPMPSQLGLLTHLVDLRLDDLPSLSGSIPEEIWGLARNNSLASIHLGGSSSLTGIVPEGKICSLATPSCTYHHVWYGTHNCTLEFDCTDLLCGCECPCS